MESSKEIDQIRAASSKKREEMLMSKARHEMIRQGKNETTPSGITAMLNAEKLKRKYAKLRKYKHPKRSEAKVLEVPAASHDINDMWKVLKEYGRDASDIQWEKVQGDEETINF